MSAKKPLIDREEFMRLELQYYRLRELQDRTPGMYGGASNHELIETERRYLKTAPLPTEPWELEKYEGLPAYNARIAGLAASAGDDDDGDDADLAAVQPKAPPRKEKTPPKKAPKTYPRAIVAAIGMHGMLSRAGLANECKAFGSTRRRRSRRRLQRW